MKGIIALDIDGTITFDHHLIDSEVSNFLRSLYFEGWIIFFVTGRGFALGCEILRNLDFPYYLGVHNGVTLFEMPGAKIVSRKLLKTSCLPKLDKIFSSFESDYVIYSETKEGLICYFRPLRMKDTLLKYLSRRFRFLNENWIPLDSYDQLSVTEFSAIKYFGPKFEAELLAGELSLLKLHAPIIKDPFDSNYYVVQATHEEVSKGHALNRLMDIVPLSTPLIIAAGDDNNDLSMLRLAHIKVVMATAPENLLNEADIIAPSAKEKGIITGLKLAIRMVNLL